MVEGQLADRWGHLPKSFVFGNKKQLGQQKARSCADVYLLLTTATHQNFP
jgi:hypothetical protein